MAKRRTKDREPAYRPSIVGENLKRFREEHPRPDGSKGLTQAELGELVGQDQGNISMLETGRTQYPGSDLLKRCAEVLGKSMEDFWRPVDGRPAIHPAIQDLINSKLAGDIDPRDLEALERAVPLLRNPTPKSLLYALDAIRGKQ